MGILNVTPDSFSDGGRYLRPRRAVARALQMVREGADLIDVGGESTRPGARPVPAREEMGRVLPVVEALAGRITVPISVDTSKASVASAAIRAGATLVNDVTGLRDPKMAEAVARSGVPVVLMHMRGTPRTMKRLAHYRRVVPEVVSELKQAVGRALAAGVQRDRILIDPGIGFAKGPAESLAVLKDLAAFRGLGFPVVVGPSRKSFIGHVLGQPSVEERPFDSAAHAESPSASLRAGFGFAQGRLFGTAAAVALAVAQGVEVVRVHDVAAMRQVADVCAAILRA